MYTNNKLSKAVRLAIAFGAASSVAFVSSVQANDEEEAKAVERIQVTGSRLKRTDLEGAMPITVIDREQIDVSGQMSVSDLLRNTTFNSFGSFRSVSGSSGAGATTVNLRGLGSSRTLVLIDGRRLPTSPILGSGQDMNVVPLAAVERVEILSDGASAVYGSDAIGGVINIITRKDYDGAEIRLGLGRPSIPSEGGDREEGSLVVGTSSANSSILAGFSWNNRDIVFERAFPWNEGERGISPYGNNWAEVTSIGTAPSAIFAQSLTQGCDFELFFTAQNPWIGGSMCSYDFRQTNANDTQNGTQSAFFRAEHRINDDWSLFSNATVSKSKAFGRYAASLNDPGTVISANSMNNPTNPDSPLFDSSIGGEPRPVAIYHRFAALGTRDTFIDNYNTDVMVGAQGVVNDIDVEFGVRKTKTKGNDIGRGYLLRSVAAAAMEDGRYMLNDPFGERFTDPADIAAHDALLNSLNVTTSRITQFDQQEVFANATFDIFEMNAGTVQLFVGGEYRKEEYSDRYDAQSEAGTVGGSAGSSAGGGRNVRSAFFETLIPVTDDLEFNFAGRYDRYSDYGGDFSPKLSVRYEPMEGLVLRASVGQGFRAPSLDILTQQPSSGNPTVTDRVLCDITGQDPCPSGQIRTISIANADLESEQSTQMSLGLAYQPTDWLNFTFDYYNIKIDDAIRSIGLQTLINMERAGDPLPSGLSITRDPATGAILESVTGFANLGDVQTSGWDLNVQTNFDLAEWGRLRQNLQVSNVINYSIDGGRNLVLDPRTPRNRVTFGNYWSIADLDIGFITNVIGKQYNRATTVAGEFVRDGNIATWVTHDVQVKYNLGWNADVSVGVQNIFEKFPQTFTGGADGRGFDWNLYDGNGRITYIRYTQRF